ncbi:MAG: DUF1223 domain-containing protein [Opitutus sp.]
MRAFLWFTFAGLLAVRLPATELSLQSGPQRVALLELFTSEGCSSCPPAEAWLGTLRVAPGLWRDFVPIAFHVDYWNQLGWPDGFSSAAFTQRSYGYAKAWGNRSVYTPCLVQDGRESRVGQLPSAVEKPAGLLTARYNGTVVNVTYAPGLQAAADSGYDVHAALLGSGIQSVVTAGENRGRTLPHDFVVLALIHGSLHEPLTLPRSEQANRAPRLALAVWVTRSGHLEPLQATGNWLD